MSESFVNREFYVQLVDEASFVAVDEFFLGNFSVEEIARKIGCHPDDLSPGGFFLLDDDLRNKVDTLFKVDLSRKGCEANLISWSASDGIPYRTHSGREFILMRDKLKPLSVFTSMIPFSPDSLELPTSLFAPLLSEGRVVTRHYCEIMDINARFKGVEVVLYAHPSEEWRLDAYMLVRSIARKVGWSEPLVRMEGALLGYSEWQNDAFIAASPS